jgi:squalene synthase HpnC
MSSPDVAAAYAHCQALARRHYENFPVASLLLPSRVRPAVAAIYAYARTADDFADEPEHAGARDERLRDWLRRLDDAVAGRPEGPVFVALADAIARFDLPLDALRSLVSAFRQDVTKARYATFDELLDYCTRSANPVGRLVLALHDVRDAGSLACSDATCTALQLTNHWQDVAIDLDKDRIYVPHEDMARFGVTEAELHARRAIPAFRRLLAFEVERTREVFAGGWPLVRETPGRLGLWLRCVWAGGHAVLRGIEAADMDVFARRPALRTMDWIGLAVPAVFGLARPRPARAAA